MPAVTCLEVLPSSRSYFWWTLPNTFPRKTVSGYHVRLEAAFISIICSPPPSKKNPSANWEFCIKSKFWNLFQSCVCHYSNVSKYKIMQLKVSKSNGLCWENDTIYKFQLHWGGQFLKIVCRLLKFSFSIIRGPADIKNIFILLSMLSYLLLSLLDLRTTPL